MPDIVHATSDHQLYTTNTATTTTPATTTTSSSSELMFDGESDDGESATPDMDSQMIYVRLKEVQGLLLSNNNKYNNRQY